MPSTTDLNPIRGLGVNHFSDSRRASKRGTTAINREGQTPGSIAIWVNHSNIGENVRITALKGAEILLAPHQTGGCDSPDPHTMGLVDKALWENRHADPTAIEAELHGPKGRG